MNRSRLAFRPCDAISSNSIICAGSRCRIVHDLADWPRAGQWRWGEWLDALSSLAPRVLRQPARVLRVLHELRPLAAIGPVSLREVREVLSPRLLTLTHEPPRRRHGRVLIGTPAAARGRSFDVVFVPGLAERVFPQRLREDALLLDERRDRLPAALPKQKQRADDERLHLRLAVGAANERVYLSWPRVELQESRQRVPSFYVLDITRAIEGQDSRLRHGSRSRLRRWRRDTRVAGAGATRARAGRFRARPVHAVSAPARQGQGSCAGPGSLSLRAQSSSAALVDRPLGALATAVAHRRRADSHDAGDGARAGDAAPGRAAVLALSAATLRRLSVSIPAVRDLSSRAARRARAAAAARPADSRQPVPQHPGGILSCARTESLAAGQRVARGHRARHARLGDWHGRAPGVRRSRARDRSRLARRAGGDRARPSRLARRARAGRRELASRSDSSSPLVCPATRTAIRARWSIPHASMDAS